MAENNAVVRVYGPHAEAEAIIKELQRSGFDMNKLSIVGKDYYSEARIIGSHNSCDRMEDWEKLGAFWGGLWSLLFRSGFFFIPDIGPIIVFGPLVSWIVRGLEDAEMVGGLSALGAGLYSIGISKNSNKEYERALNCDKRIVIAHCTLNDVIEVSSIFRNTERGAKHLDS